MTTTNSSVFKVLRVVSAMLFVGLFFQTATILYSSLQSLFADANAAKDLYRGLSLYELLSANKAYYINAVSLLVLVNGLKTYVLFLVMRVFKIFNPAKPFESAMSELFMKISYFSLGTGVLALIANGYFKWLLKNGTVVPVNWGSEEILVFAGVIYILALVFQKGTELQTENDLTV